MTLSMHCLKLECQRLMRLIMGKETFHGIQVMKQHNQSEIQSSNLLQINLDEQSKAFRVFSSNSNTGHHWINRLMDQLSNEHQINPSQFIDHLLREEVLTKQQELKKEQINEQFEVQDRQYEFFNQIPTQAFLICSLEQISREQVLFVVRSFSGQIIYLSISRWDRRKIEIVRKFSDRFSSQTLLILIDSIDYRHVSNTGISEYEMKKLCQNTDLIYLKRQVDNNLLKDQDNYVRYKIDYNSLLEKYNYSQQLYQVQDTIPTTVQMLLKYFFLLVREELALFANRYADQLSLLKLVIQLNYKRSYQKEQRLNQQVLFSDFIHKEIFIYDQMQNKNSISQITHFPQSLSSSQSCYYCQNHSNIKKKTNFSCQGCYEQIGMIIPLCAECFQPFHFYENSFKIKQKSVFFDKNKEKSMLKEKKNLIQPNVMNFCDHKNNPSNIQNKSLEIKKQVQQEIGNQNKNEQNCLKKQIQKANLTRQQIQKIMMLQQSSQKLIRLFKQLKNYKRFYKPTKSKPKDQKQFGSQARNQLDIMKAVQVQFKRQIQMFQQQAMIRLYDQKKKEDLLKQQLVENVKVKIEYKEDQEECKSFMEDEKLYPIQEEYESDSYSYQ